MKTKKPYAKAVRAYCKGCIYDPQDKGTWLAQVEACLDNKCELYEVRPLPKNKKPEANLIANS